MRKLKKLGGTRIGFLIILVFLMWFKTVVAYYADFHLGLSDPFQHFTVIVNPIGITVILLSLCLFINRYKLSYSTMFIVYLLLSILLYSNVLYYREASNYISASTIASVFSVTKGLGNSAIEAISWHDLVHVGDLVVLAILFATKILRIDHRPYRKLNAFATTMFGLLIFSLNLMVSEANRPQLIGRTFDQNYTVKYLGLPTFLALDTIQTSYSNQVKSTAAGTDIVPDLDYIKDHYAKPNEKYFGKAAGKNVIIIHLESFQQMLLNQRINGQEVTPFLNSLYNGDDMMSFDNFYHQVKAGRTSDAETMLETGLFGFPSGNYFPSLGKTNTTQAAPAILGQEKGYTSAVFHGNVGSFYNRDTVYKNFGYDYFFDQKYYDQLDAPITNYGPPDKLVLSQTPKYLEQLQQPFYTKVITVTNHYPFKLPDEDKIGFVTSDTANGNVNNYFETANYLDSAMKEFFDYLKSSGLYDNSMIIMYGDHMGLTNNNNQALAPLLGYDPDSWNDFNDAQMQKVPFMIHLKGLNGGINHTYGGEIDVLPTILHLLGVNTSKYAQVGTDLLSEQHDKKVASRDGDFITPKYTVLKNCQEVYNNQTGELIDLSSNPELEQKVLKWSKEVHQQLKASDDINKLNLLRFYTPEGFKPVDPAQYSYVDQIQRLIDTRDKLGEDSTSMYSQNKSKSTTELYQTDAKEVSNDRKSIDDLSDMLQQSTTN